MTTITVAIANLRKILFLPTLLLFAFVGEFQCTKAIQQTASRQIDIRFQKVFLIPFGEINRSFPDSLLPESDWDRKILIDQLNRINDKLKAEFRRCEKYGLYTIVDSIQPYTVSIRLRLHQIRNSHDTLYFPFSMEIENRMHGTFQTESIATFGITTFTHDSSIDRNHRVILESGTAIMDLYRRFPYQSTVKMFYPPHQ